MYVLYKNPIQLETLYIVQYLYHEHIPFLRNTIIEINYPSFVTYLPTIFYNNMLYIGLNECIKLFETYSGILEKANEFKKQNPRYTIKK